MDPGDQGSRGFSTLIRSVVDRHRSLPEGVRVLIYSGEILFAIAVLIAVVVYRAALGRGLLLLLAISAAALLLGAAGYAVARLIQYNRIKKQVARHTSAEARLQAQRQPSDLLRAVSDGEIQPLSDSAGLFLRNWESLWHQCTADALDRKDQPHSGTLHVTSLRILFVSPTYPVEIPLGSVNAANTTGNCLNVIGKTVGATQAFVVDDPQLAAAYIARTIKAYHRQVDVGFEEGAGRRIPQDVKTAVWQRDCGKCAECGATDYLEFDHMIPFTKGGASTVDNVQLLCRRCNLKKGARI